MIVEHPRDNLPRFRRGVRLAGCNHAGATRRTCYQERRRGPRSAERKYWVGSVTEAERWPDDGHHGEGISP